MCVNRPVDPAATLAVEHDGECACERQAARERLAIEPIGVGDDDLARIEELASSTDLEAELDALLTPDQART